jgi:hypothetical protein
MAQKLTGISLAELRKLVRSLTTIRIIEKQTVHAFMAASMTVAC